MFYATHDSDGEKIREGAAIVAFETEEEARRYLQEPFFDQGMEFPPPKITIAAGSFGDCWLKVFKRPRVGDSFLKPFSYTQMNIARPGQHPGGNCYWLWPYVDVLVVAAVEEVEKAA